MGAILASGMNSGSIPQSNKLWAFWNQDYVITGSPDLYAQWYSDVPPPIDDLDQNNLISGEDAPQTKIPTRPLGKEEWAFQASRNTLLWQRGIFISPSSPRPRMTLATWFKFAPVNSSSYGKKIMGFQNAVLPSDTTTYDRQFYIDTSGKLVWGYSDGGGASIKTITYTWPGGTIPLETWIFALATLYDGIWNMYVDGISVGTNTVNTPDNRVRGLTIGGNKANGWPGASDGYWNGSVHQVYLYADRLLPDEVIQLYNSTRQWIGK